MRPLVKWPGGKSNEIKKILHHIPKDIELYIEPFVGGGALFFYLKNKRNVINDLNKDLINFYQVIKDGKSEEIYDFMDLMPNNRKTYYEIRSSITENEVEKACKFYYLRKTCYSGIIRNDKEGNSNVSWGNYKNISFQQLKEYKYEKILKNTEIYCKDFEEIFEMYNNEKYFMFLDPPYDCVYKNYGYGSFTREDHIRLFNCFKNTKTRCLMIMYDTKFIRELYSEYIVEEYPKKYKIKFEKPSVKHLVIKNFYFVFSRYF